MNTQCEVCGTAFTALRATKRFCSSRCRLTAHLNKDVLALRAGIVNSITLAEVLEVMNFALALDKEWILEQAFTRKPISAALKREFPILAEVQEMGALGLMNIALAKLGHLAYDSVNGNFIKIELS